MTFAFSPYAKFPEPLKNKINSQMWNYNQTNLAILQTSHRSPIFAKVNDDAIQSLRQYLTIPSNYKVLLMQGGEQLAQGSIPFNLLKNNKKCTYLISGPRSQFASSQAKIHSEVTVITLNQEQFQKRNVSDSAYTYVCIQDHETGHVVKQPIPQAGQTTILDCTSILGLYPINISNHGIVFGSIEFSLGLPGVTIVIVREDLVGQQMKQCPNMMSYATMNQKKSIYNTPNCFAVYTLGEHIKYLIQQGGLANTHKNIQQKIEYLRSKLSNNGVLSLKEQNNLLIFNIVYKGQQDIAKVSESLLKNKIMRMNNQNIQIKIQSTTQISHIDSLLQHITN